MDGVGAASAAWSAEAEDEAIMATNTDATECKRGAVELGYWQDDYKGYFTRRGPRKPPEINRGYYVRMYGIDLFVRQFLERCDQKCQIINIGCGFDTLYWRLRDTTNTVENFIELDFPEVVAKKCHIIKKTKPLLDKITMKEDVTCGGRAGELHGLGYHLTSADLRCAAEVVRRLRACGACEQALTLLLAECVLVYVPVTARDRLLQALAAAFPRAMLLLYEQCSLADRFGEVMVRNLRARGCGLAGAEACGGDATACADRFTTLGWTTARGWSLRDVWEELPADERARAEHLEPLDEQELLQQLLQHYAVLVGATSPLFSDVSVDVA